MGGLPDPVPHTQDIMVGGNANIFTEDQLSTFEDQGSTLVDRRPSIDLAQEPGNSDRDEEGESSTERDAAELEDQLSLWSYEITGMEQSDYEMVEDPILSQLLCASESGDLVQVEHALSSLQISCSELGSQGDSALHLASLYGNEAVVQALLAHGADASQRDGSGGLALHDACASGHIDIVASLLEAAPHTIDWVDEDGDSAMHNAARGNHYEIIRLLLEHGGRSSLELVNTEGETPKDLTDKLEIKALLV